MVAWQFESDGKFRNQVQQDEVEGPSSRATGQWRHRTDRSHRRRCDRRSATEQGFVRPPGKCTLGGAMAFGGPGSLPTSDSQSQIWPAIRREISGSIYGPHFVSRLLWCAFGG